MTANHDRRFLLLVGCVCGATAAAKSESSAMVK